MQTVPDVATPAFQEVARPGKIIIANWKMNVPNIEEWASFPKFNSEAVICPPLSLLAVVSKGIPNITLGAQDTGEFGLPGQGDLKVKYVIVGHSDRRKAGESDEIIAGKAETALKAGLKVILCVGESKEVRALGIESAKSFIDRQLKADLKTVPTDLFPNLLVAYEPIWAISTSLGAEADTPKNAVEMINFMKEVLPNLRRARFIYGGSVNAENAQGFLGLKEIEGALVGGASLKAEEFKKIISIADASN